VADTGPGIPETDLPHVFERFWRGTGAQGRSGAIFTLTLPAA
jgi:signal transduction histidine kinase